MEDKNNGLRDETKEVAVPESGEDAATGEKDGQGPEHDEPSLEQQMAQLEKMNDEYYNRMLRLQADFDNYRKRTAKEKDEIYSFVAGEILLQFLDVLDNLERASDAAAENGADGSVVSLKEGVDKVIKQVKDILTKYQVEEIPAQGEKFDPNYHHAVMQVEDENQQEGTILEVFQKGYKIKSRVLRPSMVKVAL